MPVRLARFVVGILLSLLTLLAIGGPSAASGSGPVGTAVVFAGPVVSYNYDQAPNLSSRGGHSLVSVATVGLVSWPMSSAWKNMRSGAGFVATEGASDLSPVVIGENMEGRVIPYANDIGGDYYQPESGAPPSEWMANNKAWIQEQMAQDRQIIDIGPDPARALYPAETSPYYAMEHGEIFGSGYENYAQHWLDETPAFLQATGH